MHNQKQNSNQHNKLLSEGLRSLDLENLVDSIFNIDTYRSKMGEDEDVCVISFNVKDRNPARDMMEFIEKGYEYVLDADVSSGENEKGEYTVFVELPRRPDLKNYIQEIISGVQRLTGIKEWKFKYYQNSDEMSLSEETLSVVPDDRQKYAQHILRVKTNEIKSFFSKTLMDDLELNDNIITIKKPFNQQLKFKIHDTADKNILENTEDRIQVDTGSMSEVFWLTKVLGDYGITKIGNKFHLTNKNQSLVIERIL